MTTQNVTVTNYSELATSTCTPLGGGASTCSYQYVTRTSVSTTTQGQATSTLLHHEVSTIVNLILLFVVIAWSVAVVVKKLI